MFRTKSPRLAALAASLALSVTTVSPATAQADQAGTIVIDDVTIIDVESGRAVPHQTLRIDGQRIARIDSTDKAPAPPEGTRIIPGKGLYLMPGLFDAHVHITTSPDTFAPMLLANGVTAVRDTGAVTETIIALRERARKGDTKFPTIICTGAIVDGNPPVWPFSEPCDTPEEARAAVRKLKAAGVDMIKVYSRLKPDVYRAAVAEAHAQHLKATGHIPNSVTLAQAIEAGQDCAEHLTGFERMLIELSGKPEEVRAGVWPGLTGWLRYEDVDKDKLRKRLADVAKAKMMQCPTLVVMQGIGRAGEAETANADERMAYVPMSLRAFWGGANYAALGQVAGQTVPFMQKMVGELHKAGVPLMIGTDLANPYVFAGFSVHDEMKMFQAAGIPTADVLRSATIIPARFCEVDKDLGSIAPGKLASLVLLRANPLDDVGNCQQIQAVFVRGVHHDRAALDKMLADARDDVKNSAPSAAAGAVDMNLPGEVVRRGRYTVKFNGQFDAGSEDFIITRDDGGYHIRAHNQPLGGYQPPSLVTFHVGKDFAFKSGEMKQLTQKPLSATYELKDRTLIATPTEGAADAKPQEFAMPDNGIVTAPISACNFAIFNALADLKVDDKRELQAVGFGFAGWQVAAVPYSVTRKADEEITLADGTKVKAHRFTTVMTSQGMTMNGEDWTDASDGVLLRSVLRAPFGMIETVLSEQKRE